MTDRSSQGAEKRCKVARLKKFGILSGLMLGAAVAAPPAAGAFELFGFRLWGSEPEEDRIEIIDPLPYTATLRVSGTEDDGLQKRMETASALWSDRETPASGNAGLISKARGDYRRLLATLYAEGYYGPYISIRINGVEAADLTLAADLPQGVPVAIEIQPGPPFLFGTTHITNAPPFQPEGRDGVEPPRSVGFETGESARSGAITAASALAVEQWRQLSYAKAREADREVIADHPTGRLDVDVTIDPGRKARYGTVTVEGGSRVDREFVAYMANIHEGAPYDPDDLHDAEDRLSSLGVFRSIRIVEEENILEDGSLPMTIVVEDRRRRTIGFGGTYSTIDGLGVQAYWMHRNLLGKAERLRFDAGIEGLLLTSDPADYNYNLGVTFTKPGVISPDTSFFASLLAQQLDWETYRQTSLTARAGFSQRFGEFLTGDLFGEVQRARFTDDFGTRDFLTFALVGRGEYDRRNDPLNATSGYYLAGNLRPFYEAKYGNPALRGTIEGRAYLGFSEDDRFVLAGRAKIGGFGGPPVEESPPDMLFFAGGGGSVRGYAYNSIGVETTDSEGETGVVGGRGLVEGSGEFRFRVNEKYGGVAFADVGVVAAGITPDSSDDVRVGVGLGFRYFTGIGPLRVDVATPINPRPEDSIVAVYFGIGQAF
ncbi:MAG: outer membrane protein assembly factor [Rhodobacteraceae bacterium]|nr:outer membrane protein assembly factor [Paracoccaceae bacterium]